MSATLIVVNYMGEGSTGYQNLEVRFEGECAEATFATWLRVVGPEKVLSVRGEV